MGRKKKTSTASSNTGKVQDGSPVGFVFVDQEGFEKHTPASFG